MESLQWQQVVMLPMFQPRMYSLLAVLLEFEVYTSPPLLTLTFVWTQREGV